MLAEHYLVEFMGQYILIYMYMCLYMVESISRDMLILSFVGSSDELIPHWRVDFSRTRSYVIKKY